MRNFGFWFFLFSIVSTQIASAETFGYKYTFTQCVSAENDKKIVEPLELVFVSTDTNAVMLGNNGSTEVLAIYGEQAVTYIERLESGATQTTTIDVVGKFAPLQAVHRRHTILGDRMIPSQYYGTCEWQ